MMHDTDNQTAQLLLPYQAAILDDIETCFRERALVGQKTYGSQFVGDPLEHAWEEALDLVFYLGRIRQDRRAEAGSHEH